MPPVFHVIVLHVFMALCTITGTARDALLTGASQTSVAALLPRCCAQSRPAKPTEFGRNGWSSLSLTRTTSSSGRYCLNLRGQATFPFQVGDSFYRHPIGADGRAAFRNAAAYPWERGYESIIIGTCIASATSPLTMRLCKRRSEASHVALFDRKSCERGIIGRYVQCGLFMILPFLFLKICLVTPRIFAFLCFVRRGPRFRKGPEGTQVVYYLLLRLTDSLIKAGAPSDSAFNGDFPQLTEYNLTVNSQ
jgi:hypothetical protein